MVLWLASALAGAPSVRLVVSGEELAVHHGEYCSFPRLAGVTTEAAGAVTAPSWDAMFDADELKRSFTGLVRYDGDVAVGAHPLAIEPDLRKPGPDPEVWSRAIGPCRLFTLEGAALPELLRKLAPAGRSVAVRALANEAITSTSCGASQRPSVLEDAFACGAGRCDAFVARLEALHGARCD
ncbi:MAG: hypothetical protein H6736_17320 [Alphaproteobacteria bacterium]|nr:hypothetical protein [Alphaproteobacteria bacterium]